MITELFDAWDIIYYYIQGILMVLVQVAKLLFTTPMLLFVILGFIRLFIKVKARR